MSKDKSNPLVGYKLHEGYNRYENYEAKVTSQDFTNLTNFLVGQMFTIVDASIADKTQREAMKSIVKKTLWNEYYEMVQRGLFERQSGNADYPLG